MFLQNLGLKRQGRDGSLRLYVAFDLLINMMHNQSNINHREVMTPARKAQNWLPSIFNDFFGNEWVEKRASSAPAVNIIETESAYKVEIAAPGMTRHDFRIDLNDSNELIVSMQKCAESGTPSDAGKQVHFKAMRKMHAEHQLEKTGEEIRKLYSWNKEEDKLINN